MGAWGEDPTASDDFEDAWMSICRKAADEAVKLMNSVTRYPERAWAGVGVVLRMANADMPIAENAYMAAVKTLEALKESDFASTWRDPASFRAELKATQTKLKRLRKKADY